MKRYYTVKETAKLLGVSTNTIYTYLDEGKIKSRRVGRGRFRIPKSELSQFIDIAVPVDVKPVSSSPEAFLKPLPEINSSPVAQILEPLAVQKAAEAEEDKQNAQNSSSPDSRSMSTESCISSGGNDYIFFKLFKSVSLLGLGLIYIFCSSLLLSMNSAAFQNPLNFLVKLIPFALVFAGALGIYRILKPENFLRSNATVDAVSGILLVMLSYFAILGRNWGLFVFSISLTVVFAGCFIHGVKEKSVSLNFFNSYTKYLLLVFFIGGVIALIFPDVVPVKGVSNYINLHKELSTFLWLGFLVGPLVYIISPLGKKSNIQLPFFAVTSAFCLIIATELTLTARWEQSYMAFLTGIFGLFMAWWSESNRQLAF